MAERTMSKMKAFAEQVSIEMGYNGELNEEVLSEAQYRMLVQQTKQNRTILSTPKNAIPK